MTPQQTIEVDSSETQSFAEWIQSNTRLVGIAAALLVVAGAGYWFYLRSGEIKRLNAERGLNQAKQSLTAGNAALAQSDLQKVAVRYKGTPGGSHAALLYAQLQFDQGKYDEGLKSLQAYQSARAAGPNLASIWSLTADGQLASGKPAEAAASYQKAADATKLPGEKALYEAKVGRALMTAGKDAEAKVLWERLASDPNALPVRNEAMIRLGELEVKPAGKS